jgi:hypothetical protein
VTHTTPLPPLPDITTLATSRHPALAQVAAALTGRPARLCAFYEDSPYVAVARLINTGSQA